MRYNTLAMTNVTRVLTPRFPENIPAIRAACQGVPLLNRMALSDIEVELLWESFSSSRCAQYLIVNDADLNYFKEWLQDND